MGLFQQLQDGHRSRMEREIINKVVRVLSKSMDLWISMYQGFGTPPTSDECAVLEDTRIEELMAEYRPRVAKDLGREILVPDLLVDNRNAELEIALREKKGRLFQKFQPAIASLEGQAAEILQHAVSGLTAKETELRGVLPMKPAALDLEFQEFLNDVTQDIETRFPGGLAGLTKYDPVLPDEIPNWETFQNQIDTKKAELMAENEIVKAEEMASMKRSAEAVIQEKINASIRAAIDEIKLDLSDDVIPFLDDPEAATLTKELMELTEAYGVSRLA